MNFKQLIEKRNEIVDTINAMFAKAETEKRAFNEDEVKEYEKLSAEIKGIDSTLKMHEEARSFVKVNGKTNQKEDKASFEVESRAFASFLRKGTMNYVEERAEVNMTMGANGAVVPTSIADKIIETVHNIAPVLQLATRYNVKGTLTFPKYDETEGGITCAYAEEFKALTSTSGKFTSVALGGFLVGALSKISRSLINNAEFDIVSYVVAKVAEAIARFLERELLLGTGTQAMSGVLTTNTNVFTTAASSAITADDLIAAQLKVAQPYQASAVWVMNENTLLALRKLKDGNDRYLLNDDIRSPFGYSLLGKHVYISDNAPDIAAGAKAIAYGDFGGLYVNLRGGIELQVLNEKYADEHATGVVAWFEVDSKVIEPQKLVTVAMQA